LVESKDVEVVIAAFKLLDGGGAQPLAAIPRAL
jgi:hypothetical protein